MKVDKSKWKLVKLKDICDFLSRGKSPKYDDNLRRYPVFAQKCNLKEGGISLKNVRFLALDTLTKWQEQYKLKDGDLLINSTGTGTVGRVGYFYNSILGEYPFIVPDSHVTVVRLKDDLYCSRFYYYVLRGQYIQKYFTDNLRGSTNQKELYVGTIRTTKIPILPLCEQRAIATELDTIQSMIDSYKAQIADLDVLAQSIFLDMFGDPVKNEKGWEKKMMGEISCSKLGKTLDAKKNTGSPYPYLCAVNVGNGCFNLSNVKEILLENDELERYRVRKGDLLICEGGDTGRCAIWESETPIYYQNALHRVRFHDGISNQFVLHVMLYYKKVGVIDQFSHGQTIKHFTQKYLKSLSIPLPPLSLQHKFASFIESLECQKVYYRKQLADAETLMSERMQYYFS